MYRKSILICIAFAMGTYLVLFWRSDLSAWDMQLHLNASSHGEVLWPWFQGWNRLAFGGYPQGYFYPPLFHWLVGGLTKIIHNLELSYKIIISSTLISLPFSIYFFLKSIIASHRGRILAYIWIFIMLFIIKGHVGGDFYSTFAIGLVSNFFALPFYFWYLYFLRKGSVSYPFLLISSICLSLIMVSHLVTALAAIISSLAYFVLYFHDNKKQYIIHVCLSILICAFWIIPYLYFFQYQTGVIIKKPLLLSSIFLVAFLLSLFVIYIKKSTNVRVIFSLFIVFLLFMVISKYGLSFNNDSYPMHIYRLFIFVYLWMGIIISQALSLWNRKTMGVVLSLLIFLLSLIVNIQETFYFKTVHVPGMQILIRSLPEGRGLVVVDTDSLFIRARSPHYMYSQLMLNDREVLNGGFVESTGQSVFVNSLLKELDTSSFIWGTKTYPPLSKLISKHVKDLGISWLLSLKPISPSVLSFISQKKLTLPVIVNDNKFTQTFYLYIFSPDLVHIIEQPVFIDHTKWKEFVEEWWMDEKASLQASSSSIPSQIISGGQNGYHIRLNTTEKSYVYVRIPYFQAWHAYDDKGHRLALYRAAPDAMIVKAEGDFYLRFERSKIEHIGYFISVSALLFTIWELLKSKVGFKRSELVVQKREKGIDPNLLIGIIVFLILALAIWRIPYVLTTGVYLSQSATSRDQIVRTNNRMQLNSSNSSYFLRLLRSIFIWSL